MIAPPKPLEELTEKEWDALLFGRNGAATLCGWKLRYHTLRSKGSTAGFPDRVLVRDRIIFAELKSETGVLTTEQREWLDGLSGAGAECYLWRPSDLDEATEILGRRWSFDKALEGRRLLRTELWSIAPKSLWIAGRGRQGEASP